MINDWDLMTVNHHRLRTIKYEVAVLPVAAVEPHNLHLPHGQDVLAAVEIGRRCCQGAWEKTSGVVLLPALPYGVDCNMMSYPMAMHVSQATLDAMIREILGSLKANGIRKVILLNGHGGNCFVPLVRQAQCDLDMHIFTINWWEIGADKYAEIFANRDDHAGETETSVALATRPDLVELAHAGDGQARPYRFEALQKGWARTSRDFANLNDHCGVGDPRLATAEKGRQYLDLVCGRITQFLIELAQTPIDDKFPHA